LCRPAVSVPEHVITMEQTLELALGRWHDADRETTVTG
jgi:hypothetical protein